MRVIEAGSTEMALRPQDVPPTHLPDPEPAAVTEDMEELR
jgi:hypothetical protein